MHRTLHDVAFAWKPAWTARVLARVQGTGDRFAADEILTILSAGEAGLKVDDVCAAADIPIETYYTWKAKYRGLTPAKVRDLRRREQRIPPRDGGLARRRGRRDHRRSVRLPRGSVDQNERVGPLERRSVCFPPGTNLYDPHTTRLGARSERGACHQPGTTGPSRTGAQRRRD